MTAAAFWGREKCGWQERIQKMQGRGKRLDGYRKDYVVFDLETTGISPQWDEIIELSAIKVQDGEIVDEFSTLVNPGRPIPKGASAVNGITDRMVADAPQISEVIGLFLDFVGDAVLVGHNIHCFDMKFLYRAAAEKLGKEPSNDYIDTLYMARKYLPQLSHHKLTDISSYFHISTQGAHRALNDCVMNQRCYEEMGKLAQRAVKKAGCAGKTDGYTGKVDKKAGCDTASGEEKKALACPVCGAELVRRNGRFGEFYGCRNFPRCRYTRNT